jgi:hypothetical protein
MLKPSMFGSANEMIAVGRNWEGIENQMGQSPQVTASYNIM